MRRYLSEEINGRNLLRPKVGLRVMAPIFTLYEEQSFLNGQQTIFVYEKKIKVEWVISVSNMIKTIR